MTLSCIHIYSGARMKEAVQERLRQKGAFEGLAWVRRARPTAPLLAPFAAAEGRPAAQAPWCGRLGTDCGRRLPETQRPAVFSPRSIVYEVPPVCRR